MRERKAFADIKMISARVFLIAMCSEGAAGGRFYRYLTIQEKLLVLFWGIAVVEKELLWIHKHKETACSKK